MYVRWYCDFIARGDGNLALTFLVQYLLEYFVVAVGISVPFFALITFALVSQNDIVVVVHFSMQWRPIATVQFVNSVGKQH